MIHNFDFMHFFLFQTYDDKMKADAEKKKDSKEAVKFTVESPTAQKLLKELKDKCTKTKAKVKTIA